MNAQSRWQTANQNKQEYHQHCNKPKNEYYHREAASRKKRVNHTYDSRITPYSIIKKRGSTERKANISVPRSIKSKLNLKTRSCSGNSTLSYTSNTLIFTMITLSLFTISNNALLPTINIAISIPLLLYNPNTSNINCCPYLDTYYWAWFDDYSDLLLIEEKG